MSMPCNGSLLLSIVCQCTPRLWPGIPWQQIMWQLVVGEGGGWWFCSERDRNLVCVSVEIRFLRGKPTSSNDTNLTYLAPFLSMYTNKGIHSGQGNDYGVVTVDFHRGSLHRTKKSHMHECMATCWRTRPWNLPPHIRFARSNAQRTPYDTRPTPIDGEMIPHRLAITPVSNLDLVFDIKSSKVFRRKFPQMEINQS